MKFYSGPPDSLPMFQLVV